MVRKQTGVASKLLHRPHPLLKMLKRDNNPESLRVCVNSLGNSRKKNLQLNEKARGGRVWAEAKNWSRKRVTKVAVVTQQGAKRTLRGEKKMKGL